MPFVHPSAVIIGNVTLGRDASVWPTAVLRGDSDAIVIGDETNVQDGTIVHVDPGAPVRVGSRVTIGHRAVIHGCTIEDDCLIGIGAIILNRAVIGAGSMVGAGAVVTEGMVVPPGSLVLGVPAKVVRAVDDELRQRIARGAAAYLERLDALGVR
ncbi:MAG: gamma carbonic anhydrase family protein [Gemmatimonadetes bacterium]|nr:gamma carbonic anhydrase family protein [Gemmatimonadota bacterium]